MTGANQFSSLVTEYELGRSGTTSAEKLGLLGAMVAFWCNLMQKKRGSFPLCSHGWAVDF